MPNLQETLELFAIEIRSLKERVRFLEERLMKKDLQAHKGVKDGE